MLALYPTGIMKGDLSSRALLRALSNARLPLASSSHSHRLGSPSASFLCNTGHFGGTTTFWLALSLAPLMTLRMCRLMWSWRGKRLSQYGQAYFLVGFAAPRAFWCSRLLLCLARPEA